MLPYHRKSGYIVVRNVCVMMVTSVKQNNIWEPKVAVVLYPDTDNTGASPIYDQAPAWTGETPSRSRVFLWKWRSSVFFKIMRSLLRTSSSVFAHKNKINIDNTFLYIYQHRQQFKSMLKTNDHNSQLKWSSYTPCVISLFYPCKSHKYRHMEHQLLVSVDVY